MVLDSKVVGFHSKPLCFCGSSFADRFSSSACAGQYTRILGHACVHLLFSFLRGTRHVLYLVCVCSLSGYSLFMLWIALFVVFFLFFSFHLGAKIRTYVDIHHYISFPPFLYTWGGVARLSLLFCFPCSADHERD